MVGLPFNAHHTDQLVRAVYGCASLENCLPQLEEFDMVDFVRALGHTQRGSPVNAEILSATKALCSIRQRLNALKRKRTDDGGANERPGMITEKEAAYSPINVLDLYL